MGNERTQHSNCEILKYIGNLTSKMARSRHAALASGSLFLSTHSIWVFVSKEKLPLKETRTPWQY